MSISRVAVVGAGIVGVALAREITRRIPDAKVTVFDKAEGVAAHQSGHTSGIVDSGLEQIPGSPGADLARRGVELLVPFVTERGIPYRECGQLLIAQNTDEADRLEEIFARAKENRIPGVRLLERKEMREVEPNARGVLALYSPHAAVTDFAALTEALASDVTAAGGTFRFGTEVTDFDVMSNKVRVHARPVAAEGGSPAESGVRGDGGGDSDAVGVGEPDGGSDAGSADDDEQVHEAPRTYHGDDATGPVVDFGDELRNRFGDQDWFKQVEGTLGNWTEKLSKSWPPGGRGPVPAPGRTRATEDSSSRDGVHPTSESSQETSHQPRSGAADATSEDAGSYDLVFVCAGLQADRLATVAGFDAEPRIVPFTSDYYAIAASDAEAVRGIIGSVPDPHAPFAETGMIRGVDDSLMLGPNTFVSLGREKYAKREFDLGDMGSTARFKGFWKFAAQTARTAAHGAKTVVSRSAFVENVQKYVPVLDADSVEPGPRGVRAQAMNDDGELLDELITSTRGRLTTVRSVPRAGATSALAIAERIADEALDL